MDADWVSAICVVIQKAQLGGSMTKYRIRGWVEQVIGNYRTARPASGFLIYSGETTTCLQLST